MSYANGFYTEKLVTDTARILGDIMTVFTARDVREYIMERGLRNVPPIRMIGKLLTRRGWRNDGRPTTYTVVDV